MANVIREYFEKEMGPWASSFTDHKLRHMMAEALRVRRNNEEADAKTSTGNPIRDYFEDNLGEWATYMSEEDLDILAVKTINNFKQNPSVFSSAGNLSVGNLAVGNIDSKIEAYFKKAKEDEKYTNYDIEIEDVVFGYPLMNGSGKRYKKYSGIVVEDKIGNNRKGMPIRGHFENIEDVKGGIVIANGKRLFVRGMTKDETMFDEHFSETFENVREKKSEDVVKGRMVYVIERSIFTKLKNSIFTKDVVNGVELYLSNDNKYVRIVVNKKVNNDGFNASYALYYSLNVYDEEGNIIKG